MSNQQSITSFKSCILLIAMGHFLQLVDAAELTDSAYNLQGPFNDVGVDYGGYYPGMNQGGYPNNNVPVSQTPIFQSSFGTKGGSKARQDYGGGNNHWWNWKNVVRPKPVVSPISMAPQPIYTNQKTNQVHIDNDVYGRAYDTTYNQPSDYYNQYQSGKIIQSPATVMRSHTGNIVAPLPRQSRFVSHPHHVANSLPLIKM